MAKKNNLNEDLKRFKLLLEYDFYIGEDDSDEENIELDDSKIITEEPPKDGEEPEGGEEAPEGEDPFAADSAPEGDMGAPEGEDNGFGTDEPEGEDNGFGGAPEGGEEALPPPEPMEDEVDIDVTELVQNTQDAKNSADNANQQISNLLSKFDELSGHLDKMSAINTKIDSLENEIEKRNPTPEEQLEMRSLSSYPYNLKLTDYWAEKEGNYDVMKGQKDMENKEYVLTQDEVDDDYNDVHIKDSFDTINGEDKNDFKNKNITY